MMANKETKKMLHWGWMTGEAKMLRELEAQAKQGWFLCGATAMHLILKKGEPGDVSYAVDMPPLDKQDEAGYLKYFEETGWKLACRNGAFYIFYANKKAAPIHTDRTLLIRLRRQRLKFMLPLTALFLVLTVALVIFGRHRLPLPLECLDLLLTVVSAGLTGLYATITGSLLFIRNHF